MPYEKLDVVFESPFLVEYCIIKKNTNTFDQTRLSLFSCYRWPNQPIKHIIQIEFLRLWTKWTLLITSLATLMHNICLFGKNKLLYIAANDNKHTNIVGMVTNNMHYILSNGTHCTYIENSPNWRPKLVQ